MDYSAVQTIPDFSKGQIKSSVFSNKYLVNIALVLFMFDVEISEILLNKIKLLQIIFYTEWCELSILINYYPVTLF